MRRRYPLVFGAFASVLALVATACGKPGEPRPDLLVVSTRDGDYAIYALDADGSRQERLSSSAPDVTSRRGIFFQLEPAWSPNGRRVAFSSGRRGTFDLFLMDADGTGTRRLTTSRGADVHPTWSPDGTRIAFGRLAPDHIYVMNADGTGAHRVTDDLAGESEPSWSPDGRWIVYVRRAPGTAVREIWRVRPDGTDRRRVTRVGGRFSGPAWSPNSERIAFAADIDGPILDIYSIGVDGEGLRRHTQSQDHAIEPSWSPDGTRIAFARAGSIFTVELDGNVEAITEPENNDSSPAWKPVNPSEED